jgi:hypothetical protein
MMENIKYIKFHNKRIIPDILCMHIDKHKKITKIIRRKNRNKTPDIIKTNSSGAEDL